MAILKQSTAYTRSFFMVKSTDAANGSTGQSTQISLVLYKGSSTTSSTAAAAISELGFGWYSAAFTIADLNTIGDLVVHATSSSGTASPTNFADQVQSQVFTDLGLNASGQVLISSPLKQGVALNGFQFVMTSGGTPLAGLGTGITGQRTLGGAGFSALTNGSSEIGGGWYVINLSASDTNSPSVGLRFTASGADDKNITLLTQP